MWSLHIYILNWFINTYLSISLIFDWKFTKLNQEMQLEKAFL